MEISVERYEELVSCEESYRVLKNAIMSNVGISYDNEHLIVDDDRALMAVFQSVEPNDYERELSHFKHLKKEDKDNE